MTIKDEPLALRGAYFNKGESRRAVLIGLIFWATLPLAFAKGDDGKLAKGTELTAYTTADINY